MTELPGSDVLTNSSEQCFMLCPRKYYWSYVLGLRPRITKTPLRVGHAMHEGLDILAQGLGAEKAIEAIGEIYDRHSLDASDWSDPEAGRYDLSIECVTIQCLIEGYDKAWVNSSIEIIETEKAFDLKVINPETGASSRTFTQAGKRDRIGRLPDGRLALMESKSTGEDIAPGSDYWQPWPRVSTSRHACTT